MKKPTPKASPALDFDECTGYIEEKYGIQTRDYARSFLQFSEWHKAKGYGDKDAEGKDRGSSKIWFAEYNKEIADGKIIERPYQDFWHWLIEAVAPTNGGTFELDKELTDETETWQKEILSLYLKEFGNGPYRAEW